MPKDKRLYMTFPIDVHRHPKMLRLSSDAKWAFVEMNGEARIAGNDGRFAAEDAEYLWPESVLTELLKSHPTRPLIVRDGSHYVIRDYAEHQQTVAEIEELSAKRSAAGRQGAARTNAKRSASVADIAASAAASAEQEVGGARQSSAESESEIEPDNQLLTPESLDPAARDYDESETEEIRQLLTAPFGRTPDDLETLTVAAMLLESSPRPVQNVVGYVRRCIDRSPVKVRGLCVEASRQAMRVRAAMGDPTDVGAIA